MRNVLKMCAPPILMALAICVVWQFCVWWFDIPVLLLASPLEVVAAIYNNFGDLARAMGVTALAALGGFAGSLVVGTLVSLAFAQARWIRLSCYPYAILLQTVPIVAIAPLIIIWCGYGFQSNMIIAFIVSLFPMITNGTAGMLSVDPELLDLFRLHRASRWQVLTKLQLPNAVPHLLTGARTASGLAVIGAIVGEFFTGFAPEWNGLGYQLQGSIGWMNTAETFAAVLAAALLGMTIFGAMSGLDVLVRRRWYDAT